MTLAEALVTAEWQRVTAAHMQPGCYVVRHPTTGNLHRYWPSGSNCTFIPHAEDEAATWTLYDKGWS